MAQPKTGSTKKPEIVEMQAQKMAVISGKGASDKVFSEVAPALYGSVYTLKFDLKKMMYKGKLEY